MLTYQVDEFSVSFAFTPAFSATCPTPEIIGLTLQTELSNSSLPKVT